MLGGRELLMKQVIQDFKSGKLYVDEVPVPSVHQGYVLVRNQYSLISAGTERSTVITAQASLIGKARQRPDLVKQTLESLSKDGFAETLKKVRAKLDTLKELGYSSAGTVLMSMDTKGAYQPGDRVACGGGNASHAGLISVPQNLVVHVPDSVPIKHAAFTTLGSIALQGLRQADPKIGDFVCVIGLGLLGQITAQLLKANGCQVYGIDTSPVMVELATKLGCHIARLRTDEGLASSIGTFTEGHGFDSVIITAAARTNDPIVLGTEILRKKGAMVLVGAVPIEVPREPNFYQKELELKISCSYGPGRYDLVYEEEGHDYPYGYVRWTENRNMAAFLSLLEKKAIDINPLITHEFFIDDAERAYDIVTGKTEESSIAILIKYPESEDGLHKRQECKVRETNDTINIGLIGAGNFAKKFLIPHAGRYGHFLIVVDSNGVVAKSAAENFNIPHFSTDVKDLFSNKEVNAVFIATRHNTHAELTLSGLEAGKNIFVEKPLTIKEEDIESIAISSRKKETGILQVGFNRRFAPLSNRAKEYFDGIAEPLLINYRINAGFIPPDNWIQTSEGGGRILGEVCHFVDFLQFVVGSYPIKVYAESARSTSSQFSNHDNVIITIGFADGSVGQISYLASGSKELSKEHIEIFGGGRTIIIEDFKYGDFFGKGRNKRIRESGKGHKDEIELFLKAIREGLPSPIPIDSILYTTITTFRAIDSLNTGLPQRIEIP